MNVTRNGKIAFAALAFAILVVIALLLWSASAVTRYPAPPRVETALEREPERSVLVTRAAAPLAAIRGRLESALATTLVTFDQQELEDCVPAQRVRVLDVELVQTPSLSCKLDGTIKRGPISLSGNGRNLVARVPIRARIDVLDLGDVIKRETITAAANVTVTALLDVSAQWTLEPRVNLAYRWTTEPGIDVLGQRIAFTSLADKALAGSLDDFETTLEAEIRRIDLRSEVEAVWREGHGTLSINRENPPVWMRVTPRALGAGAISVSDAQLSADLRLEAELDLTVGERPEPASAAPLGANTGVADAAGFALRVPVLADYDAIEQALLTRLQALSMREIFGDTADALETEFRSVRVYATSDERLAVGIEAEVTPSGILAGEYWGQTRGTVWLTGRPFTRQGSAVLSIGELAIYGDTDRYAGDVLVGLLDRPFIKQQLQQALVTDFREDYERIIAKAQAGLRSVRIGEAELSFKVEEFDHGKVSVTSAGLFLPVTASGSVTTRLAQ